MADALFKTTSEKIYKRELKIRVIRIALLLVLIFLIMLYFILSLAYDGGRFTVMLDRDTAWKKGIIIYEDPEVKDSRKELQAKKMDFMDNISVDWLPKNLNEEANGAHNGDNYIAYTFYVENQSDTTANYWSEIIIDDVIKNVDDAIRFKVYQNDEETIYAKINSRTEEPEKDTTPFFSDVKIMQTVRKDFKPGDIDKITIVIWIEGDDPECTDALLGGELKSHMEITGEHIE